MWHAETNYGHSAPFAIRRRSSLMARRDKLWSFCTCCHPEAASSMTRGDKLWSFCTFSPSENDRIRWHVETNYGHSAPFVIQRRRARWHAEINYGHSTTFRHSETIESDGMRRRIMVISHLFTIWRRSSPMACGDELWSFCTFSPSRDDRVRGHAQTNYGHSGPFVIQRRWARWHAETNYGHSAPFHHPETIKSDGMRRRIMVILNLFAIRRRRARWHVEINYGHSTPFRHSETIESDGTQRQIMVILCLLSSRGGEPDDMQR